MKRHAFTLVELLVVVVILVIIGSIAVTALRSIGGAAFSSGSNFSSGERVGTVMKVGYKGNITKAWSVEVALQGSGVVWETDVQNNDPTLVAKFRRAARVGKLVEIDYTQPTEENMDFHYSTPYRATDVKFVTEDGGTVEVKVTEEDVNAVKRLMQ